MRANWFGLAGERVHRLLGRLSGSEILSGIPGSRDRPPLRAVLDHRGLRRGLPDAPARSPTTSTCARRRTGTASSGTSSSTSRGLRSRDVAASATALSDLLYSLGTAHPGRGHPAQPPAVHAAASAATTGWRSTSRPSTSCAPASAGCPGTTRFRRLLSLPEATLVRGPHEGPGDRRGAAPRCTTRSRTSTSRSGLYAEPPPAGFGFSDTAFRIFILMASRRLKSDRFFTTDFRPEVYTPRGHGSGSTTTTCRRC